jgi:hypothetical protein
MNPAMRIIIAYSPKLQQWGTMAFELWSCVTYGEVTAARDGLAMIVLHGGTKILLRLASLGELAYLFEALLGLAMAVFAAVGFVRSFGRNALSSGSALIAEKCTSLSDERQAPAEGPSRQDAEVTIRLDERHLWLLRRHRCIVTFQTHLGGDQIAGREVWYAKGEKSRT